MKICACGCGKVVRGRGIYYHGHRPEETFPSQGVVCACGCGKPIPSGRQRRYYAARFIVGHNQRVSPPHRVYSPKPEEIPTGICECGCEQPTPIAEYTSRLLRWFKGHPKPYISSHHARITGRRGQIDTSHILTEAQAAYLAGILDGEGSIMIRGRSVRITIGNTSRALIDLLQQLGGGVYAVPPIPNRRESWRWQIGHRDDCLWFLRTVEPYVLIRRERVAEAIARLEHPQIKTRSRRTVEAESG